METPVANSTPTDSEFKADIPGNEFLARPSPAFPSPVAVRVFIRTAGVLLCTSAAMLFIGDRANPGLALPRDPIFGLSHHLFMQIGSGATGFVSLILLFSKKVRWQLALLAWFSANILGCRLAMLFSGCPNPGPFFNPVGNAFGLSAGTVCHGADLLFGGLFLGGSLLLILNLCCRSAGGQTSPSSRRIT